MLRRSGLRTFIALAAGWCALAATCSPGGSVIPSRATPPERSFDALARVPRAEPAALRRYGALAIRQGADLYLVDADAPASRAFRRIEHGAPVRAMTWSYDGKLLAFVTDNGVWMFARDSTGPHRIAAALSSGDTIEWSPRAELLLIARAAPPPKRYPSSSPRRAAFTPGTIDLIDFRRRSHPVALLAVPDDVRWSASGTTIDSYTFGGFLPYAEWRLERMGIFVAHPSSSRTLDHTNLRVASEAGGQVSFAARVPHSDGLLFWHGAQVSASLAADGRELGLQAHPGARPADLGTMLVKRHWISFSADGRQFVFVRGPGREAWHAKSLAVCSVAAARCRTLAQPPSAVAVDPLWAPHGDAVAFVRADDLGSDGGYGEENIRNRWIRGRRLWLQRAGASSARELSGFGAGIFWPCWSRDAKRLLVFRDGAIWLGKPNGARPLRIVSGLARPNEFPAHFLFDHGVADSDDAPFAWTGGEAISDVPPAIRRMVNHRAPAIPTPATRCASTAAPTGSDPR